MQHKGTITIETDRLMLRRFNHDDVDAVFQNWTGDDKVTKFLRWPTHENKAVTKDVLSDWISQYSNASFYQWTIVLKSLNETIGTISVVAMDEKVKKVQIGYCIGSKWWHCGYTSEALSAIIAFFFEQVGVNRIEAIHDSENPNSGKVMQKCGLMYEGTLRQADWNNRGIVDACMYGMLASDYAKMQKKEKEKDEK